MRPKLWGGALVAVSLASSVSQARASCVPGDAACIRQQVIANIQNGHGLLFNFDLGNRQDLVNQFAPSLISRTGSNQFPALQGLHVVISNKAIGQNVLSRLNLLYSLYGNNTFVQSIIGRLINAVEPVR